MLYRKKNSEKTLTGSRLKSYAYALLCRKEYSKSELIEKLLQYAIDPDEVNKVVEQLTEYGYQSDQRVAEQTLRSQRFQGKGPQRIKQKLLQKSVNSSYIEEQLQEIDWTAEAYQLKVRKFGTDIEKDAKKRAKQIRFLQYRGYDLDIIFKVIDIKEDDYIP